MFPVSFLIADLGYSSHAKQLSLIAPALKAVGRSVTVYSLTGDGPFAGPIRSAGISIEGRHGRRPWDLADWFALRRRVRATRDGILHVFGASALRRLHFATIDLMLPPIVLSLTGREFLGTLDVWLGRRVKNVVVPHLIAADSIARQGIPHSLIRVVPLAVADAPPAPDRQALMNQLRLPPESPLVMAAGHMNRREDLFGAVWVFEFLRYPDERLRMLVIGDGPGRAPIEFAADGLAPEGSRIHFLGSRPDAAALLRLADLVLIPQPTGGANLALEAMAAERAVAVADTPDLRAVVDDGHTGLIVPVRNAPESARRQYRALCDPEWRRRAGAAAGETVRRNYSVERIVRAMESVYSE
jgi:glycosyltransferase involved in cell wall biosynthesis